MDRIDYQFELRKSDKINHALKEKNQKEARKFLEFNRKNKCLLFNQRPDSELANFAILDDQVIIEEEMESPKL